jgi:anti-anti-sigma factor
MPSLFRLTNATVHDVPVLRIRGDLTFDQNVSLLHHSAVELKAAGHTLIVLDLTDVAMVDSTGIGALVAARQLLGPTGRVILLRASARLRTSLDMIHVTPLFELVDDENDLGGVLVRDNSQRP